MLDRFSICEVLAKQHKIDQFLKGIVTGHGKWAKYDNIVQKRSWLKRNEAAQMVGRPGRFCCAMCWTEKESSTMSCFLMANH